jgi:cell division septation protein DedD
MTVPDDFFLDRPRDNFKEEIEDWLTSDLTAALAPKHEQRRATIAPRFEAPARPVRTDWPQDVRSEIYIHRLMRIWMKRLAMVAALFVIGIIGMSAFSFVSAAATPGALPEPPAAPAVTAIGLPVAEAPAVESAAAPVAPTAPVAPAAPDAPVAPVAPAAPAAPAAPVAPVAPAAPVASADYVIAVGVFANREHADQLADTLERAGLPAMPRSLQRGARELNQIVIGPVLSRADAGAGLRRLRALGGFDDARVISGTAALGR